MSDLSSTLFQSLATIHDTEEAIGEAFEAAFGADTYEELTWDFYDHSLEVHGVPNDLAMTEPFLAQVWGWGFVRMWLRHQDNSESYFHKEGRGELRPEHRSKPAWSAKFDTYEAEAEHLRRVVEQERACLRFERLDFRRTKKRWREANARLRERLAFIAERAGGLQDGFPPDHLAGDAEVSWEREAARALGAVRAMALDGLGVER